MFENLKEKLGGFKKILGGVIESKEKEVLKNEPVEPPEKAGILDKIKAAVFEGEFIIEESTLKEHLWELEMALLESDVALPVAENIVESVKVELVGTRRRIGSDTGKIAESALRNSISKVISVDSFDFDAFINKSPKPVSIVFVGVNGTGKTTTVAKMAERFRGQGYSVVIAAGDTFRAGAIEQIERHAETLGIKIIKHQEGADPAAIVYDAIQFARAKHKDIVLADTAGRMHTNVNLMDQLKKVCRVNKPDLIIFVDEAIAGNDAIERAKLFNSAVPFNGSILTKQDADAKGGAAISISYATGKPILFLGVGQTYKDLVKFDPDWLLERLFE
ncbi:MAG: signal recognition particle-docking protein FtsY [Candidatus Methanoperedens sp.]|nr:signal recognition particle-docking protein FtsY [Candidatus Methanoperedens sp.]MCE8428148.1 signal recognition particle-docking protein FtsY [Candidatus Methanoperedens sp.]